MSLQTGEVSSKNSQPLEEEGQLPLLQQDSPQDSPQDSLQEEPQEDSPQELVQEEEPQQEAAPEEEAPEDSPSQDSPSQEAPTDVEEPPDIEDQAAPESEAFVFAEDSDLSSANLDWLPEEHHEKVRGFLGQAQEFVSQQVFAANRAKEQVERDSDALKATEERFSEVIDALDGEEKKLAETYRQQEHIHRLLERDINSTAWAAFDALYGKAYAQLPEQARLAFTKKVQGWTEGEGEAAKAHASTLFEYGGESANMLERLELALKASCTEAGCREVERYEGISSKPSDASKREASKQAVIGAGEIPPTQPTRSLDDVSFESLMNRHDHLL